MTADWCPTCKVNLSVAINREAVKELVQKYDVVALKADSHRRNGRDNALLEQLQSKSIPICCLSRQRPYRPYVLRDSIWQQDVLDLIKLAGPSKTSPVSVMPTSIKITDTKNAFELRRRFLFFWFFVRIKFSRQAARLLIV